jgi:hypothetical protein
MTKILLTRPYRLDPIVPFFGDDRFGELSPKWLQLLKEIVPGITKLVVLWDPSPS